jgi:hypothetical protein
MFIGVSVAITQTQLTSSGGVVETFNVLTEAGDNVLTEAGDFVVTEDAV